MPRAIPEIKAYLAERRRNAALRAQEGQSRDSSAHHGFNPNQPRVPAGNPHGGEWTSSGRNDSAVLSDAAPDNEWQPGAQYAQNNPPGSGGRGSGPPRIGPQFESMESGQAARLALAEARHYNAIRRVHELDPRWRPTPTYSAQSAEGLIRTFELETKEAESRIDELARYARLAERHRADNEPWNLFGFKRDPDADTVSVMIMGGRTIYGSNSEFLGYKRADWDKAIETRDALIALFPEVMNTGPNAGQIPNNTVFHAEATVLLRAAAQNGGKLTGRTLEVYTDQPMCQNCPDVLPKLGLYLGNPRVTFIGPNGTVGTMYNGQWMD